MPTDVPSNPLVYRVEIERDGRRVIWAVIAHDLVTAARRALELAGRPGDRVVALQAVAELL